MPVGCYCFRIGQQSHLNSNWWIILGEFRNTNGCWPDQAIPYRLVGIETWAISWVFHLICSSDLWCTTKAKGQKRVMVFVLLHEVNSPGISMKLQTGLILNPGNLSLVEELEKHQLWMYFFNFASWYIFMLIILFSVKPSVPWCVDKSIMMACRTHMRTDNHYNDVIMRAIASQITGVSIVCSAVCSGAYQRKHQSPASLAFVRGIHRRPVNSSHKGPVTRKMFPFHGVIMMALPQISHNYLTILKTKFRKSMKNSDISLDPQFNNYMTLKLIIYKCQWSFGCQ